MINGYLRKYIGRLGHYNHATEVRENFLIQIVLAIGEDNQKATGDRKAQDQGMTFSANSYMGRKT